MPATKTIYSIGIKQTGGSPGQSYISFVNGRTGDKKHILTVLNEAIVNLGNKTDFPNEFQNSDVIDITGTGLKTGNITHTINTSKKGNVKLTMPMTDVSTTNAPAIAIG